MSNEEKIYVFSYGTIQDPQFYKELLPNSKPMPAILNGYAKCVDETMYFLLKKDLSSQVKGSVFEISKEELFLIDRWELFPQYQRFQVNVLLTETNEILENVYVYTKLEVGKYYLATDDMGFSRNPNANENNLNAFIEMEKAIKDFPLTDYIFLYDINEQEFEEINKLTHPYAALIIDDKENRNYVAIHGSIFAIKEDGKMYAALTSFSQKSNLNSIFYYQAFNEKLLNSKPEIMLKSLYDNTNIDFLINKKPVYYLSSREDKAINETQVGWYENKAFELVEKDFDIDPFIRFNKMLKAFFDTKQKNDK